MELQRTTNEEPVVVSKDKELALIYNRDEMRMKLVWPDVRENEPVHPEEVILLGIFHRLGADQAFLDEAFNYVTENPELMKQLGFQFDAKAIQ